MKQSFQSILYFLGIQCISKSKSIKKIKAIFVCLASFTLFLWDINQNLFISHYNTLHISPGASQRKIQLGFRQRSLVVHPDRNPDKNAASEFKTLVEAFRALSNPEIRWKHNNFADIDSKGEATLQQLYFYLFITYSNFLQYFIFCLVSLTFLHSKIVKKTIEQVFWTLFVSLIMIDIILRTQPLDSVSVFQNINQIAKMTNAQWSFFFLKFTSIIFSLLTILSVSMEARHKLYEEDGLVPTAYDILPYDVLYTQLIDAMVQCLNHTQQMTGSLKNFLSLPKLNNRLHDLKNQKLKPIRSFGEQFDDTLETIDPSFSLVLKDFFNVDPLSNTWTQSEIVYHSLQSYITKHKENVISNYLSTPNVMMICIVFSYQIF